VDDDGCMRRPGVVHCILVKREGWRRGILPGAATVAIWVFNTFGTADLLFGFYQGSRISLPAAPAC
jgi:hypothetical protein